MFFYTFIPHLSYNLILIWLEKSAAFSSSASLQCRYITTPDHFLLRFQMPEAAACIIPVCVVSVCLYNFHAFPHNKADAALNHDSIILYSIFSVSTRFISDSCSASAPESNSVFASSTVSMLIFSSESFAVFFCLGMGSDASVALSDSRHCCSFLHLLCSRLRDFCLFNCFLFCSADFHIQQTLLRIMRDRTVILLFLP